MADTLKQLYHGAPGFARIAAYTVPNGTKTILKSINISNALGGPACRVNGVRAAVVDSSGNIYFADGSNYCIRKVGTDGTVTLVAGQPGTSTHADGIGPAAGFVNTLGLALDSTETYLYVGDNYRIRRITLATGQVTTIAGTGVSGHSDNAIGTSAQMGTVYGLALSPDGNTLYFVSNAASNFHVRKVNLADPQFAVTTLSSSTAASALYGLAINSTGTTLYTASGSRVYSLSTSGGTFTTIAGTGTSGNIEGIATSVNSVGNTTGVALSSDNQLLYIMDQTNNNLKVLDLSSGRIAIVFGGTVGTTDGAFADSKLQPSNGDQLFMLGNVLFAGNSNGNLLKRIDLDTGYTQNVIGPPSSNLYMPGACVGPTEVYASVWLVKSGSPSNTKRIVPAIPISPRGVEVVEQSLVLEAGDAIHIQSSHPGVVFTLSGLEVA